MMRKKIYLLIGVLVVSMAAKPDKPDTEPKNPYSKIKRKAELVLIENCNPCHKRMNPSKVFSAKNMELHAAKIEDEALIKKRMPLGFWNKLEEKELQALQTWVDALKNQPHAKS